MPADIILLTPADRELLASQSPAARAKILLRLEAVQQIEGTAKGTKNQATQIVADRLGCTMNHAANLAFHFRKRGLAALVPKSERQDKLNKH